MHENQENSNQSKSNFFLILLIAIPIIGMVFYFYNSIDEETTQTKIENSIINHLKDNAIQEQSYVNIKIQFADAKPTMLEYSKTKDSDSLFIQRDKIQELKIENFKRILLYEDHCLQYSIKHNNPIMYKLCKEEAKKYDSTLYYENQLKSCMDNLNKLDSIMPLKPVYMIDILITVDDEMNSMWTIFLDERYNVVSRKAVEIKE